MMKVKRAIYVATILFASLAGIGCGGSDQGGFLLGSSSGGKVSYPLIRDNNNAASLSGVRVQGSVTLSVVASYEHQTDDLSGIRIIMGPEGSASACSDNGNAVTTETDADGNYTFDFVPEGSYSICAEMDLSDGTHLSKVLSRIAVNSSIVNETLDVGELTLRGRVISKKLAFDIFVVDVAGDPIPYAALSIKAVAVEAESNGLIMPAGTTAFDENGYFGYANTVTVSDSEQFNPEGYNQIGVNVFTHVVSKEGYNTVVAALNNDDLTSQTITLVITLEEAAPVQVGTDNDWSSVQTGEYHIVALKKDGSLYTWGDYTFGSIIGDADNKYSATPRLLGLVGEWRSIEQAHRFRNYAIKKNGSLWGWIDGIDAPDLAASGEWKSFDGLRGVANDGSLWAWTYVKTITNYGSAYTDYIFDYVRRNTVSLTQLGSDYDWQSLNDGSVLKEDNSLWSLSINCEVTRHYEDEHLHRMSLDTDWHSVDGIGSYGHVKVVIALKKNGTLWGCGRINLEDDMVEEFIQVGIGSDWKQVSTSSLGSALLIKEDGTLWRWDGDFYAEPIQVGVDTDWAVAAAGARFGAAIKTDGTLWSWGNDWWGKL